MATYCRRQLQSLRWEVGVQASTAGLQLQLPEAKGRASSQLIGIQQQLRHLPNHYRTIVSNSHIHILENASLVIRDVQRQDQGFYLCQAANNFGSLSALIRLTVNGEFYLSLSLSLAHIAWLHRFGNGYWHVRMCNVR